MPKRLRVIPPCSSDTETLPGAADWPLSSGAARLGLLDTLAAIGSGAAELVHEPPRTAAAHAHCVAAVLADPEGRLTLLGGKAGMRLTLGSVHGGAVVRFLSGSLRSAHGRGVVLLPSGKLHIKHDGDRRGSDAVVLCVGTHTGAVIVTTDNGRLSVYSGEGGALRGTTAQLVRAEAAAEACDGAIVALADTDLFVYTANLDACIQVPLADCASGSTRRGLVASAHLAVISPRPVGVLTAYDRSTGARRSSWPSLGEGEVLHFFPDG